MFQRRILCPFLSQFFVRSYLSPVHLTDGSLAYNPLS